MLDVRTIDGVAFVCVLCAGESWGHAASTRVVLHWQGSERYVYVPGFPVHVKLSPYAYVSPH